MSHQRRLISLSLSLLTVAAPAASVADEREELLKLKNTTVNLIDRLVKRGLLDAQDAKDIKTEAESQAAKEASKQRAAERESEQAAAKQGLDPKLAADGKEPIRVAYVPNFVKKEIRDQVRAELREEVVNDVKAHAKNEKWGIPAALPEWVSKIRLSGDVRLRVADEFYDSDNAPYTDFLAVNRNGGLDQAQAANERFLNTTNDRLRLRERLRIGLDAQLTDRIKAGFRLATSNIRNPVSNNQTLGNTGQSYEVAIDRGFLQYDHIDDKGTNWFSLYGGRIINPFVSTDVVYDPDLSFEGLAGSFRWHFNRDDSTVKAYHPPNPRGNPGINLGMHSPDSVFMTVGVFPIQEVSLSSHDKWLFGGQIGADWLVHDESRLVFAASYYEYENIRAKRNTGIVNSREYDWTAPQFIQKGNSMVPINDSVNHPDTCPVANNLGNICLFGLASDFRIFNATASYDFARFAPTHVQLTVDYAKNLGYNRRRIASEFGPTWAVPGRTNAWQVRLDVGRNQIRRFGDWSANFAYRYIERDAVLDAFTDSVFHQGGTDAKGWVVGVNYGIASNTWLNLRWFSTDAIDGAPYSIDTANLDLNAAF